MLPSREPRALWRTAGAVAILNSAVGQGMVRPPSSHSTACPEPSQEHDAIVTTPPNLLLFLPDGMQAQPLGPDHPCLTPNVDRLARRGVSFSRAYTPLPTCSPARASLMTGLLPHNHGVLQVEHCVDPDQSVLRADRPHWAQRLAAAGYRTGFFGKWHIERTGRLEDFGWQANGGNHSEPYRALQDAMEPEQERLLPDAPLRWQTGPKGYAPTLHYGVTDLTPAQRSVSIPARTATEFLSEAIGGDGPWCCCVSYRIPNEALICSRQTFERYDVDAIDLPATLEDDMAGRPSLYRRAQEAWSDVSERQWREALACYYARITEIDEQLGLLLDQLERAGVLEDTIVVVTADHGRYLGAHGMDGHQFGAFEEIYGIPLIVSGPGLARDARTSARVGLHDLCPTILELTGAEAFDAPDSRSFAPVLRGPAGAEAQFRAGYAEYHGTRYRLTQRVYWEDAWKFVFNGFDYDELYNLAEDPHETRNVAAAPAQAERVRRMMGAIWQRIHDTGDRTLRNAQYGSMRFPAVGPDVARR